MLTFAQRPPPGMQRVLDAMRSIASEAQQRPRQGAVDLPDWKPSLIRGHRKVLGLDRKVLATHDVPQAGRASIRDRIARIEAELASLDARHESSGLQISTIRKPHEVAAQMTRGCGHEYFGPKAR
jgi:hypothetical protein